MPPLDPAAKESLVRKAVLAHLGKPAGAGGSGHLAEQAIASVWAGPSAADPSTGRERFPFAGEVAVESEFGARCSWYYGELAVAADGAFETEIHSHPESGMSVFAMSEEEAAEIRRSLERIRGRLARSFKP